MQRVRGISGSTLKMIAMASMVTDHAAAVLLGLILMQRGVYSVWNASPEYIKELLSYGSVGVMYAAYQIMRRVIGRLAFPIYCFLLVEGFQRTGSRLKYMSRLFLFCLISEIPFDLAFFGRAFDWDHCNVFFTLFIAFVMMLLWEELERRCPVLIVQWLGIFLVFAAAACLGEWIGCDYGAKGIAAVGLLYLFRKNRAAQITAGCVAFLWEITAPLAFIPVAFYNGKKGWNLKYVFYIFYPAHLLLLYLISIKFL